MAREPTDKQREVLAAIEQYWQEFGHAPSLADLAGALGVSRATVHEHIGALKRKGYLANVDGVGRSWRSTLRDSSTSRRIPIVGGVAAGAPILAQENIEGWLSVDGTSEHDTLFALRVRGDSMTDAGILDGDLVIVRQQEAAKDGDIVVALVDDQDATIKKLKRTGSMVHLVAMNPAYDPIVIEPDRIRIQGRVVGLRREIGGLTNKET
ncbi:MAG: transcriptional repressor LexA [Myxococcales bacterium]|nr:transcriptional repressor LexA [Myxococcales bacterium]